MEDYYKGLKEAQRKNKRLGFGDNIKNWDKQQYEEQQRQLRIDRVRFGDIRKNTISGSAEADPITIDKKQVKELVNYLPTLNELKNIF